MHMPHPAPTSSTADIRLMNAAATLLISLVLLGLLAGGAWKLMRLPAFSLAGIQVSGHTAHTTPYMLRAQVLPQLQGNFFTLELDKARDVFQRQPWVRRAVVQRVFPNQLAVYIEEHEEVALWGRPDGSMRLLNRQGEVFEGDPEDIAQIDIPRLSGPDDQSALVLRTYRRLGPLFKPLDARVTALDLEPRGNWLLTLNESTQLNLGSGSEQELAARIRQFVETIGPVTARYERSFADLQYADLRYKTGYAIRLRGVGTVDNNEAGKSRPPKPKT